MVVCKKNGLVFVVDYNKDIESHTDELVQLKETYGEDNVLMRNWYIKEYNVEGRPVRVPMFADSKINRHDRRRRKRLANRFKYGEQKTNAESRTKRMRTEGERKWCRRNRRGVK